MIKIHYAPSFLKQLKKLEPALQEEVFEKVKLFEENPKNTQLKTHKLKGRLSDCSSFSINYKYRIVFQYINKKEALFTAIGSHDVYRK